MARRRGRAWTYNFASEDFGAFLDGFGFGGQLARGKGQARLQAAWPGSPMGLKLAAIDGTLHFDARDGQLTEVEPGAGRVLGLLSIARLPQRLTLDFRDFFSKGFAFNTMKGDIALGGGQARSDNLRIDGPAMEIRIRGSADMRNETYDQTVDVFPKAGNLLTAVGAIAGGPVGAAIGAAANMVLKKPLGRSRPRPTTSAARGNSPGSTWSRAARRSRNRNRSRRIEWEMPFVPSVAQRSRRTTRPSTPARCATPRANGDLIATRMPASLYSTKRTRTP